MVNVSAALPFNLHNRVLPHQGSYSRSRSISADRYQNQYDGPSYTHSNDNGVLAPSPLRRPIDLPHSSSRTDLRDDVDIDAAVIDPAKHRAALLGLKLVHGDEQGDTSTNDEIEGRGRLGWTAEAEGDSTATPTGNTCDVSVHYLFSK